jgi:predicted 3-demethylubiquinone-9 3-methyltransferase (glyoxalase superfamily)
MEQGIDINLWFNNDAKEAVDFYLSIFRDYQSGINYKKGFRTEGTSL